MTPLSRPPASQSNIRRVAILFAGGPAPAANAVISTAAVSFLRNGIEVVGILNGYSHLVEYSESNPLQEGRDYVKIDQKLLRRTRNSRGILLGTARTNPGRDVTKQGRPGRSREDRPAPDRTRCARLARRQRPDLDRRRRHAQDRQQVPAVPAALARRPIPARGSRSSTSPRRSTTTISASTSPSATSRRWIPLPARS